MQFTVIAQSKTALHDCVLYLPHGYVHSTYNPGHEIQSLNTLAWLPTYVLTGQALLVSLSKAWFDDWSNDWSDGTTARDLPACVFVVFELVSLCQRQLRCTRVCRERLALEVAVQPAAASFLPCRFQSGLKRLNVVVVSLL